MATSSVTSRVSSAALNTPRALASPSASDAIATSWQVNALVEATPISGPASVGACTSASRAMLEVGTLTTATVRAPFSLAYFSDASVSAVSPDCETKIVRPPLSTGGSR